MDLRCFHRRRGRSGRSKHPFCWGQEGGGTTPPPHPLYQRDARNRLRLFFISSPNPMTPNGSRLISNRGLVVLNSTRDLFFNLNIDPRLKQPCSEGGDLCLHPIQLHFILLTTHWQIRIRLGRSKRFNFSFVGEFEVVKGDSQ